jgi:hypothetical protein
MKTIAINSKKHGKYNVLVDDEDYVYLSKINWFLSKDKKNFYIAGWIKDENGEFVKVKMHQMIMGNYDKKVVVIDHISRDTLDNRRCNLRFITWAENARNRNPLKGKKIAYKGVTYSEYKGKKYYKVYLTINGVKIREGRFKTAEEAAIRWNELARIHHGEFAYQNPI